VDRLSFLAAARHSPDRVAVVDDGIPWTFGALEPRVAAERRRLSGSDRLVLVAEATLDVVVSLWAALDLGLPVVPLHPRLTATDRQELSRRVAEAPAAHHEGGEGSTAAAILFTSGTTAEPKGVVLRRESLLASIEASAKNLGTREDDVWLLCLPLAHVGGLSIVLRALHARIPLVLLAKFDPGQVLTSIRRHRVTLASLVPAMMWALLDRDQDGALRLPRAILVGGAATSDRLLEACSCRGVRVLPTYGLTEAGSQVATASAGDPRRLRPLPGVEVRVVGGRIEVRGPTVMAGYLGERPHEREEWLDTGDEGEIEDGCLRVSGRRDDVLITGGENVSPARVEQALEALPGIRSAVVFGIPDERWGQTVAAALVADGERPTEPEWTAALAGLAPHERPKRFVWVDTLPDGKPNRRTLAVELGLAPPTPEPAAAPTIKGGRAAGCAAAPRSFRRAAGRACGPPPRR
jgi:O-succinylbenzoic acid--CoA ligase